ncbi:MAG: rhamnulokinase [Actinomycetia bacterium]|nr:rhamnulokinase [Actinomycetes bacterium]
MSNRNYLVFDFGASNGRAAVFSFDGNKYSMAVTHRFENRPVYASGTLYWDILSLYEELKIGIQKSLEQYRDIQSLALDAWGADFGFIGKNGKLVSNPVHYRDQQRSKDSKKLLKLIPAFDLFKLAGSEVSPIFDLFQLFSLSINQAPEIEYGKTYLSIPDILNYFLTGKTFNEWTRITTTIMYNQVEKKWEDKILRAAGLPADRFAPIIKPGEKIGRISDSVCSHLGIRPLEVIAPVTHDTPSAVAGIPVSSDRNWAFLSLGTWAILGKETEKPIINKEVFDLGYSNEGGAEDSNLFIKNITGMWIIQQCRAKWIKDLGEKIAWDRIMELARAASPFAGFIDVNNPAFTHPSSDMPQVIGDNCSGHKPESIGEAARLFYEGLVLKFKHEVKSLEKLTGQKLELLHLIGGGTKDRLLCQWTADATGIPVIAGPTETTSVGNFLMQLKAAGQISNLSQGREISKNSSAVKPYQPQQTSSWEQAYNDYITNINF